VKEKSSEPFHPSYNPGLALDPGGGTNVHAVHSGEACPEHRHHAAFVGLPVVPDDHVVWTQAERVVRVQMSFLAPD